MGKCAENKKSESWIAGIFLVLNLVKLAGAALPYHIMKLLQNLTAIYRQSLIFDRRPYLPIRCSMMAGNRMWKVGEV